MPILIRVDDFASGTPPDKALMWLNLCKNYDVKTTLGLIPYYQHRFPDVGLINRFLDAGHDIAIHGYTHQCHFYKKHKKMDDCWHEFVCLDKGPIPLAQQAKWIKSAKTLVEENLGIDCQAFIEPQHLCEANTWKALRKNDFKIISEQNKHVIFPYMERKLKVFPVQLPEFTNAVKDKITFDLAFKYVINNFLIDFAQSGYYGAHLHINSLDALRLKFWEKLIKLFSKEQIMTLTELGKKYRNLGALEK